jgi:truncated hemoglobin YjbI
MRELIYKTVEDFYAKATKDVLIGYHFDKFNDPDVLKEHLVRLTSFWEMQLTGTTSVPITAPPFHLLFTHLQLSIKRGELGRWIILFYQTLDNLEDKDLVEVWKERIVFFEERFKSHPQMFR